MVRRYVKKVRTPPDQVGGATCSHDLLHSSSSLFLTLSSSSSSSSSSLTLSLQDCIICMEPLGGPSGYVDPQEGPSSRADAVGQLVQCGHLHHLHCLVALYNTSHKDGR